MAGQEDDHHVFVCCISHPNHRPNDDMMAYAADNEESTCLGLEDILSHEHAFKQGSAD